MTRVLNIFFAPLLRPMLALLLLAFSLMADSRPMFAVTRWFCLLKTALYGALVPLLVYGVFTMQPVPNAEVSLEVAQGFVLLAAYVFGALAVAHFRVAGHFHDRYLSSKPR